MINLKKSSAIIIFLLALVFVIGNSLLTKSAEASVSSRGVTEITSDQRILLTLLSNPGFTGKDFLYRLTNNKAEVRGIDIDSGDIYFTIEDEYVKKNSDFTILSKNPDEVEFAKNNEGEFLLKDGSKSPLTLGEYKWSYYGDYFFRIHISNLKYDTKKILIYKIGRFIYDISLHELGDYLKNNQVYGGNLHINYAKSGNTVYSIVNHAAVIAKKGEPSLVRLVNKIVKPNDSNELKIQKLLDFVTKKIEYNQAEALSEIEILKRPSEILMTGKSDCSGKVILYASLLEQLDVDYVLMYLGDKSLNHITIAVCGNFSKANNLSYKISGKRYFLAETTGVGFVVGKSVLLKKLSYNKLFIQMPKQKFDVYNGNTGKKI